MTRFFAFLLGVAGAVGASQAPGFTLQYMQNLNGRIDELKPLVEKFDADVARFGYTRDQAMAECATSTGLLNALCDSYRSAVMRYEDLSVHYAELRSEKDYMQPVKLARTFKQDIVESVREEFKPAVPSTMTGAAYAGGGFVTVWLLASLLFAIITLPFRRRD
ncbi:DUF2937 family protein [Parvularcula sp. IMCC14364]|uniref:DUF2937 family protein n=1 Tax=Parvularcula sp. IMCC14364 TaxID=3067902 RepID=UPI0027413866|nr:DUF2937 family protein [Parvularcula sp. IMCC14364]